MYSVVIPAYNEERRLPDCLAGLRRVLPGAEIVVADDGSTDATVRVAEESGARVVRLGRNCGKGAAVRAGALAAQGDKIAVVDADLAVPPEFLKRLFALLDGADVVLGSRRHPESVIPVPQPPLRRACGRLFGLAVRVLTGLEFSDTQCGFKGFTRRAAGLIFSRLEAAGFAFDVEVLLLARELGLRVLEMPVAWRDGDGSSVSLRKGVAAFGELARIAIRYRGGAVVVESGAPEDPETASGKVSRAARACL
ncbi:MAG: dolichyl-phosphate beta-glucosyltransferase [Moorellales bacterium]